MRRSTPPAAVDYAWGIRPPWPAPLRTHCCALRTSLRIGQATFFRRWSRKHSAWTSTISDEAGSGRSSFRRGLDLRIRGGTQPGELMRGYGEERRERWVRPARRGGRARGGRLGAGRRHDRYRAGRPPLGAYELRGRTHRAVVFWSEKTGRGQNASTRRWQRSSALPLSSWVRWAPARRSWSRGRDCAWPGGSAGAARARRWTSLHRTSTFRRFRRFSPRSGLPRTAWPASPVAIAKPCMRVGASRGSPNTRPADR